MLKVTDPVLLSHLARQKTDVDCIEFAQDYASPYPGKRRSPYSKVYRDLKTRQEHMVVSGLPMVDDYGQGHELLWRQKGNTWENGNNIFHAAITKDCVRLVTLSDQASGSMRGDETIYSPQLFIGGTEVKPKSESPTLLDDDPVNSNYHGNTLEWDYGVAKRRTRNIEGYFSERWVLLELPKGDVHIKHNFSCGLKLRLGLGADSRGLPVRVSVKGDEEIVALADLTEANFPVTLGTSATFYPDTHPESNSVNGMVGDEGNSKAFLLVRSDPGTFVSVDSEANGIGAGFYSYSTTPNWIQIYRSYTLFYTASLSGIPSLQSGAVYLFGKDKIEGLNLPLAMLNVFSGVPASNIDLAASDYALAHFGPSTPFCDSGITYTSWDAANYNTYVLNAAGLAAVSLSGVTKFGWMEQTYDAAGVAPAWTKNQWWLIRAHPSVFGSGYKPKLVVTYSLPSYPIIGGHHIIQVEGGDV